MKRRWMIPFFGMSLLLALLLGAVISISTLPVWNPIHKHVMADEMKPIHFHDADAIVGGLWSDESYESISARLKFIPLTDREIHHYEDVRDLLGTAKLVTIVFAVLTLIGFFLVGWRKVWNAAVASFVLIGIVAGIWVAIDWRSLFRALHWVIFQDASWILPDRCYSLGLFPHKVWQLSGGLIGASVLIVLVLGLLVQWSRRAQG